MLAYSKDSKNDFRTLVIEDDIETIRGTIKELEMDYNITFEIVKTLEKARIALKCNVYSFIIVDAQLPEKEGTPLVVEGGVQLMKDLLDGKISEMNIHTKFIILSAQSSSLQSDNIKIHDNCLGIYGKLTPYDIEDLFNSIINGDLNEK